MTMAKSADQVRAHTHIDAMVRRRLEHLFEALVQFERVTTRQATVIVVPHRHDEPTTVWQSGRRLVGADPAEAAEEAVRARQRSAAGE